MSRVIATHSPYPQIYFRVHRIFFLTYVDILTIFAA
jgi:hypothetical protein